MLLRLLGYSKQRTHRVFSPLDKGRDGMTLRTLLTGLTLLMLLSDAAVTAQAATTDADQIGQVHFPTSCSAEAQVHFDRAVALLHSFWFPEAIKAFHTVLETDPSCAMGYWGIAVSLLGNPLAGAPTPRSCRKAPLSSARPSRWGCGPNANTIISPPLLSSIKMWRAPTPHAGASVRAGHGAAGSTLSR